MKIDIICAMAIIAQLIKWTCFDVWLLPPGLLIIKMLIENR